MNGSNMSTDVKALKKYKHIYNKTVAFKLNKGADKKA